MSMLFLIDLIAFHSRYEHITQKTFVAVKDQFYSNSSFREIACEDNSSILGLPNTDRSSKREREHRFVIKL